MKRMICSSEDFIDGKWTFEQGRTVAEFCARHNTEKG
jgi:hypothetical protein